jgi:pyridinium-3,5-bisthiocarboxylic acid mononucleotide nickel chelatase
VKATLAVAARRDSIYNQPMRSDDLTGKHLHLDCFAGIAGDMFLGAMLDLGVPEAVIRDGLALLPVTGYELRIGRTRQMSIVGCDVKVVVERAASLPSVERPHDHDHHHDHHHDDHDHDHDSGVHAHRTWRSIREMIEASTLSMGVKRRALGIFERVALAEGRLHGVTVDEVAFHEVGAIDSIVDVVGAAVALEHLAPRRISSRPVPLGRGFTRCAHGTLPVPSPAALEILTGARVEDGGAAVELCTPTGAAIVASCVEEFTEMPAGRLVAVGYGAGDMTLPDRPNLLRTMLLDTEPPEAADRAAVVVEANVDDMAPEWCGHLLERLFAAGARDVWYTPIVMKKGRPALTVSALCSPALLQRVGAVLLAESTTIGFRYHAVGRHTLERSVLEVQTAYGPLVIKIAKEGDRVLNAAPEFEVCKAAADRVHAPLKEVYAAAMAAYLAHCGQHR